MTVPEPPHVDYAVPASVPRRSRLRRAERGPLHLWDGPGRRLLKTGCWVAAALLALPLVVPLLVGDETGADSPEAAVGQLLQGIADVDPVAVVSVVDPDEVDDPARASAAYDQLGTRLERFGEPAPPDVAAVVLAMESQLSGTLDRTAVATLAAVELDLDALDVERDDDGPGAEGDVVVVLTGGVMGVRIDPDRLPAAAGDLDAASYDMPLAEGWRRDDEPVDPLFVTVERAGRWYVSLERTADELLVDLP